MANGDSSLAGRVEVYHDGEWGTVCDDSWDDRDAEVVCRQLGYSGGIALEDCEYGGGRDPILLDDVECEGSESRLEDCAHRTWGEHNCGHSEDAGVTCGKPRLINQQHMAMSFTTKWLCIQYYKQIDNYS